MFSEQRGIYILASSNWGTNILFEYDGETKNSIRNII